jgi:hypothetical protein
MTLRKSDASNISGMNIIQYIYVHSWPVYFFFKMYKSLLEVVDYTKGASQIDPEPAFHKQATNSALRSFTGHPIHTVHCTMYSDVHLNVHKIENFFGTDFEFCVISLLVMLKY